MSSPTQQKSNTAPRKGNPSSNGKVSISSNVLSLIKLAILFNFAFVTALYFFGEGSLLDGCQVNYQPEVCYTGITEAWKDWAMGSFIVSSMLTYFVFHFTKQE